MGKKNAQACTGAPHWSKTCIDFRGFTIVVGRWRLAKDTGDKPAGHVQEGNAGSRPSPAGGNFFTYISMRYELSGVFIGRLIDSST